MSRFIFIAADFFKVTVDGQKVRATITDFAAAKAMAGKEVELVITSQIRDGVTRQAIPNEATITYTNTAKEDGTPGDTSTTPPTPPVTVTIPKQLFFQKQTSPTMLSQHSQLTSQATRNL